MPHFWSKTNRDRELERKIVENLYRKGRTRIVWAWVLVGVASCLSL
jgi:hypothetical protein